MLTGCLEDRILVAFNGAMAEKRPDVADHLLRALETLCPEEMPGSSLAEAYLAVATVEARHLTAPRVPRT
jgi:hypothetical protein